MNWIVLADATEKTDGLNTDQLVTLIIFALVFILTIPCLVWWVRKMLKVVDKQTQFQQRQCEHMGATERHMTTVDQTLAQILEELKRRPLS
ncbi:MAG: hypothetical protein IAG10_25040 [Planctomycetaceae bacterium]|nr:hypothetical protein [Planctomycetaceae bacterium]